MHRNFLRGLLICLLPCALFGAFVAFGQYRKGIDLAGGTILVYEVDLSKAKARQNLERRERGAAAPADDADTGPTGLSSDKMQQLAESLKRRIDPADLKNVIIRPLGDSRIEIILPFSPSTKSAAGGKDKEAVTEDFVQFVKNVVSQVGVLEFRILADDTDDAQAVEEATRLVNGQTPEEAAKLAKAGLPPPAPTGDYKVTVNDVEADKVTYAWVELSKEERESMGLSNKYKGDPSRGGLWDQLDRQRGKAVKHTGGTEGKGFSMLLFSREVQNEQYLADEQAENRRREKAGQPPLPPKQYEYYVLTRVSDLDSVRVGGDVTLTAQADQDRSLNPAVGFRFNGAGAQLFGRMTGRNKPSGQTIRNLAVILDEKVVSAPTLNAVLSDGGIIQGPPGKGLERTYVDRLVYILRSGALTAELKPNPVSENTVGPTLGRDTINKGMFAIAVAFGVVLVFMLWYYRFAGFVACVALLANLLLTVGFMVAVNAAFTLAGLAGIVLMLGMAVDANVLIYERLREEREKGATLAAAIRNGYDRALPTIIDTHLSSIFTAIVLYTFGNDNLKGFSISLTVGLVISLFTSLYMTRLMFDFWLHKRWITSLSMHRLFARPNINFMKIRHAMFTATVVSSILGLGLFLARGEKVLNVDFTKGTAFVGRLTEARPLGGGDGLLDLLGEARQKDKLRVKDVVPFRPPTTTDAGEEIKEGRLAAVQNTYQIFYEGTPQPVVVTLANPPEGKTDDERLANLKERAAGLPDVSVEQVMVSELGDDRLPAGLTKSFNLRTTERERELVQVMLDRLLRKDNGESLLTMTAVQVPAAVTGPTAELAFDHPTSVAYVKELLNREFALAYRTPLAGPAFDLTGVPSADDTPERRQEVQSGKYKRMTLSVAKNPGFQQLKGLAGNPAGAVAGALALADPKAVEQGTDLTRILTDFKRVFESRPVPERLETFDPSLAADTRSKAMYAIIASWAAILLYLWFRFGSWTFGLAAVLCLIHDLCFTLGMIAVSHYLHQLPVFGWTYGLQIRDFKIDLVAVAALLTLVGYSVNDTIVVFDRIREVRGKNPLLTSQMINDSINQTLSRTVLASLTVFLVVGVLYFFGGEGVHLFAFVMVMGVIVGTYSSIYIASPLLLMFGEGKPAGTPAPAATQAVGTRA